MGLWTARLAFFVYALAVLAIGSPRGSAKPWQRPLWTLAFAALVVHVLCAFAEVHGWSHREAYAHTARVTARVIGLDWGGGIYVNYALLGLWLSDVAFWWARPRQYHGRRSWVGVAVHGVIALMYFQAAVVFAPAPARWISLAVFLVVATVLYWFQSSARSVS